MERDERGLAVACVWAVAHAKRERTALGCKGDGMTGVSRRCARAC